MPYPSIFSPETSQQLFDRIDALHPHSPALWGKMNVAQMLAHVCVPYEQIKGENTQQPPWYMKLILKIFLTKILTNEVPYQKNSPTAPAFLKVDVHDFEWEKSRLKNYIIAIEKMGAEQLCLQASLSLGMLNETEWNNMLYKHLDHHLKQFGV
ncbi:DUF1569 domain-containing protein [Aquirufa aurantiipilula]|uniref:DUF1569 domain-containing protein n=1 Tax=Aquirufa aurantiipilula TaxID=2696561 RepID=A0ABT6BHI1_9BACT|nr:DUF1569 domain-containing protein [Aquirufa aurantiipilula]MDF5689606.1 DUF1569 domain-containing protein [Aquirufa aurantiipilula]